jgi:Undecaprenyl-phosphate glucose phosphotransferase
MAEPDIAIDIISSATRMSGVQDGAAETVRRRPGLAARTLGLVGLDAAVTALLAMACYALFNPVNELANPRVIVPTALLMAAVIGSFLERGLYAAPAVASSRLHGRRIALAWVQAVATGTLVTFCAAAVGGGTQAPADLAGMTATLRGAWLPVFLVAGLAGVVTARSVRIRVLAAPEPLNRTVIIGDAESIHDLVLRLRTGGDRSFDIVGVVDHAGAADDLPAGNRQGSMLGLPMFAGLGALERMIRLDAVDTVLVALPWSSGEQAKSIVQRISMAPVDVYVYPGMHALKLPLRRASKAFDLPLMLVCNRPIDGWRAALKRAEDIVLSLGLLLCISPVMLAAAAAVKLTSAGPVFFRQRRLGYNNRVIEVLKFRSMYTHLSDADAAQQTCRGDKRVTRVGAFLRKSSLDELPQLLNVLKGDMSLVGPRPHALATTAGGLALEEAVPVYPARHRVKPGITGWAQVNGYRGALDSVDKIVNRVNYDLYYIENWSLGLDIKILCKTVRLVFADDKAF